MQPAQNKSASAVQLKHIPSGIAVKSQATRSRTQNRKVARQLLADKVEEKEKGKDSRIALKQQIERNKKANRKKKTEKKYAKHGKRLTGEGKKFWEALDEYSGGNLKEITSIYKNYDFKEQRYTS